MSYTLGEPKYDVDECHQRGMTFAAPLKVTIQLVIWDVDPESGARSIKNVKEQEVYFGEIPLMTEQRHVHDQRHRARDREPAPPLARACSSITTRARRTPAASCSTRRASFPYRGSWIDFEFDPRDILFVRIDRRRKFHATVLLRALGMTTEDLLNYFYKKDTILLDGRKAAKRLPARSAGRRQGDAATSAIPRSNEIIVKEGRKFTKARRSGRWRRRASSRSRSRSRRSSAASPRTTSRIRRPARSCSSATRRSPQETLDAAARARHRRRSRCSSSTTLHVGPSLRNTLLQDKIASPEEAILEIYRRLRPGDPPTPETATAFFNNLFFNPERYDLSRVGRLKLNHKLKLNVPLEQGTLRREDILEVVRYLIELKNGNGQIDDIDHLGNRRVRAVGELVENQYRIGLVRMERAIKERMSLQDIETLMPQELINYKPVSAVIKEFFGSRQLSQFMDQTNPLSEITHKRRLSALGPGGLTRERAGFEVRDVHPTHYGRVCPIETPEGPNIGLIASLSTYARVNEFGFVETPYREVEGGPRHRRDRATSPRSRRRSTSIAQANAPLDAKGALHRRPASPPASAASSCMVPPEQVEFMDVSPNQLVSVAASLIPFLENDDANRALMGSNMQRQAVPLLRTEAPLVGTGMERVVARDSGVTVVARRDGIVESVDADAHRRQGRQAAQRRARPRRRHLQPRQVPALEPEHLHQPAPDRRRGRPRATPATSSPTARRPRWASSRSAATSLVAFMPWGGYNFEDSILITERVVKRRPLHLGPHRGVRVRRPRHQARPRGDHARHPERRRRGAQGPRRVAASSASAPR